MQSDRIKKLALVTVPVLVLVLVAGIYFFNRHNNIVLQQPKVAVTGNTTSSATWAGFYPSQWESYLGNQANAEKPSQLESKPYMKTIYAGTGFAIEYNEPRGHTYTIEDINAIDPARRKTGAACFTCKSPQVPGLMEKYGAQYYLMSFDQIKGEVTEPIGCADCHDPQTLELRLTRPALIEALQRQGRDVNQLSKQEMRSLVCAQCHVTYYFEPGTKKVTFPWDKGVKADQILAYFDEENFTEWTHPIAGSGLVKARHAEYETFMGSTHQTAGVSCADCHMPYTVSGTSKISSHVWQSPLQNIDQSCTQCHGDDTNWLVQRVETIQTQVKQSQELAGNAVVEAINELKISRETPTVDQAKLQEAMTLHRKAQWYLDYVMVTNGYGFHNPTETLTNLNIAIDSARKAVDAAKTARGAS
ncbi:MAG: ammonia-forming cytochrome c nitrite reductase subunit c552 [Syntrophomonadaceae bacterium]